MFPKRSAFQQPTIGAALVRAAGSWVASCAAAAKGRRRCLINWLGVLGKVEEFGWEERATHRNGGPDIVCAASSPTVYLLIFSTCIIINARKRDFLLVICVQVSRAGFNSKCYGKPQTLLRMDALKAVRVTRVAVEGISLERAVGMADMVLGAVEPLNGLLWLSVSGGCDWVGCSQARAIAGQTKEGRECVSFEASHVVHTDTPPSFPYQTIILLHVSPLAVVEQLLSCTVSDRVNTRVPRHVWTPSHTPSVPWQKTYTYHISINPGKIRSQQDWWQIITVLLSFDCLINYITHQHHKSHDWMKNIIAH